jgi:anti-sigma factor RsiW
MDPCPLIEAMLSAYLDGELTQQNRQRAEVHVQTCDACRKKLAELQRIRDGIGALPYPEPTEEQWSRMMQTTITKTGRKLGWLLGIGGGLIWAGYAAYAFVTDSSIAALIKIGAAAVVTGLALLLVAVLIERLRERKSDKYKDVEL